MTETTPLLLIPGLGLTGRLYRDQIAALGGGAAARGGRAMIVADHTGADTIEGIVEQILAKAPPRFGLVGLSMGGYVALGLMRRAPERIERLALLDTQARPDTPEASAVRLQQIAIAEKGGLDRIPALQIPKLLAPAHHGVVELTDAVHEMMAATGAEAFVRQQKAIMTRPDARPGLGAIACPTLIVVGELDEITPVALAREMHEAIPDSRLTIVPGAGHLTPMEAPEAVTAALASWLTA